MRLVENADLRPHNTLRVAARARVFAEIAHWYELERVLTDPRVADLPCLVLGEGSNVLFRDDYPGLVLRIANRGIRIMVEADDHVFLRVAAGEPWHGLVLWAGARNLWGLENLALIPGQVGAAPIQNIGAYGMELAETILNVRAFDRIAGSWRDFGREDCAFGYRTSVFREDPEQRWCITEVLLRLERQGTPRLTYPGLAESLAALDVPDPGPADVAAAVTRLRERKLPDPRVHPNAGSFFKNPVVSEAFAETLLATHPDCPRYPAGEGEAKLSAAWLIERAGLKGHRQGDAGVSERHALVLVNHGEASGRDLWHLALLIQERVFDRFGIRLEPEPVIV